LREHKKRQDSERAQWGTAWKPTGHIFTQEGGSWLHPGKVSDLFERLVAAAGLPPVRLHDLRHGAATLMLAAGIDIKVVSDTLGHSDTRITRDIYQAVLDDLARAAAEAVIKLVPRARTQGGTNRSTEAVRRMPGMTRSRKNEEQAEDQGARASQAAPGPGQHLADRGLTHGSPLNLSLTPRYGSSGSSPLRTHRRRGCLTHLVPGSPHCRWPTALRLATGRAVCQRPLVGSGHDQLIRA
jgi:hypothetical protein